MPEINELIIMQAALFRSMLAKGGVFTETELDAHEKLATLAANFGYSLAEDEIKRLTELNRGLLLMLSKFEGEQDSPRSN